MDAPVQVETWRLSAAFGLAIFAQALILAALPVAGLTLAPRASLAMAPFAVTFLGAAAAGVPASLLLDQFGRRAAFATGLSLGVAGGALAAWAIATRSFPALCVGAFWLGGAQGFALFYRHAAALAYLGGSRAALTVLLGGFAGGALAPAAIFVCQAAFGPLAEAALPALAGAANVLALPLVVSLPHKYAEAEEAPPSAKIDAAYWLAVVLGAFAWFAMTRAMARAPSALIGCGISAPGIGAAEAWHLLVMYAPMAIAARWREAIDTRFALVAGASMAAFSIVFGQIEVAAVVTSLALAGLGWSFLQIGIGRLLYDAAPRAKLALGVNDALILAAAVSGVLSA
jgi:hypothetical protein